MKPIHAIIAFIIGIVIMNLLYTNELLLLLAMGVAVTAVLATDKWKNVVPFVIATVVGGLCESLCLLMGVWKYTNANFTITPVWVPLAWGMAMVLFDEAFPKTKDLKFNAIAVPFAFIGAFFTGLIFTNEFVAALLFVCATGVLFAIRFYDISELPAGIYAGFLGAGMETVSVLVGNWHYANAAWIVPLWLPLAWFNAFLVMRRIIIK